jgi:hypothetical protein
MKMRRGLLLKGRQSHRRSVGIASSPVKIPSTATPRPITVTASCLDHRDGEEGELVWGAVFGMTKAFAQRA